MRERKKTRCWLLQCLVLVFFANSLFAQRKTTKQVRTSYAKSQTDIPADTAVTTGKLANGFTYYIRHNAEPKNRVSFYLVNKAGSILEDDDQQGLAHFMEHMNFNGTTHFPKNELVDYLQKAGVRFGADLNAFTGFDETVYQLPLPADNPEILKNGFEIMHDWAQGALLDPLEIDKERGVILEEERLHKGVSQRMQDEYFPVLLNHSRYSQRIPIGKDTILEHFKPATIRRFFHDWYRPDLQALIVVGDIDVKETADKIKAGFADLKNPKNERTRTNYEIPLTGSNQYIQVTDKEMTNTVIQVIYKRRQSPIKTREDYRLSTLIDLYNDMASDRFNEKALAENMPYIRGSAGIHGFITDMENLSVSAVVKPEALEDGFKAVWRQVEQIRKFGFTQSELDRVKMEHLKNLEHGLKEKSKTSSDAYVNEYMQNFLTGEVAPGIDFEYKLIKQQQAAITLKDINELSDRFMGDHDRDMIIMAPEKGKEHLPDEATIQKWINAVKNEKLEPYVDDSANKPLLASIPQPGKITSEKDIAELGITEITLSNGLKVVLKPTDFKNNEISFTAFSKGGTSLYSDADFPSANNAANIVSAGGLGPYNFINVNKYLAGKLAAVQPYIIENTQGINGHTTDEDLETAFQLIYLTFKEPRKDVTLFNYIIKQQKDNLATRSANPDVVFADTANAVLSNYNYRRSAPSLSKISQISLDKCFAIYKERFADASAFTFTFVGNFTKNGIKPFLEKYLGSLPSTYKHEMQKDLGIHEPEGHLVKTVYSGSATKASVALNFSGKFNYSTAEVGQLNALREVLEIRLLERLREDESGVYSPNVNIIAIKIPEQRYRLTVNFGCSPQNAGKLIQSALDEINKLRQDGPPLVNVEKYKAEAIRNHELLIRNNSFWLNYINMQYTNDEAVTSLVHEKENLELISPESLKNAAVKYLNVNNLIELIHMPEENGKPVNP